jgi:hypothetical protein
MLRRMIQTLCVASALITPAFASAASQIENQPQVMEKALQLAQKGVLKQKGHGHVYLEVSKEFADLLPLIQTSETIAKPWFLHSKYGIGSHINVMDGRELLKKKMKIKELGNTFNFTVKEVRTVKFAGCKSEKTVWFLVVDAPELEKLREGYGLSPKFKDREFHIVIGTQSPKAEVKPAEVKPVKEKKDKKDKKKKKEEKSN